MSEIKIAPSILSADFSKIGKEVCEITECGADYIHLDVMDGNFVPNITFGQKLIKDIRGYSNAIFDSHLMILNPWKYIEGFADAGSDIITVHYEACENRLIDTLKAIKSFGVKCGVAINPDTSAESIKSVIENCDMVLIMSVFPGFGGQKFLDYVLPKVKTIKEYIKSIGKEIDIEIDGGINLQNAGLVKSYGANVLVAGNTVYKAQDKAKIIAELRQI